MSELRTLTTVLLVDDDEDIRVHALRSLSRIDRTGLRFIQADNVGMALETLSNNVIDLVVCDFNIGRESGLTVYLHVQKERPSTQFIFFSGSSDFLSSTFPESDFFLGAVGKANIDDLTKLVNKWLRDRSKQRVHDGK